MNRLSIIVALTLIGGVAYGQYTPMSVEDTGSTFGGNITITSNLTVSGDLDVNGLDIDGTGALTLGAADATSVAIADTLVATDIQGPLSVDEAATFDAAVTIEGKLVDQTAGAVVVAAQGTVANYLGPVHYDVFTFTNTAAIITHTEGTAEGEGVKLLTFPQGRILILGAAINATVTCTTNVSGDSTADVFLTSIGTAAAGDEATLTSTEADIIGSTIHDMVGAGGNGGSVFTFEWEADMVSGADTVFDGTASAAAIYYNSALVDANTSADLSITNTGTFSITWVLLGDD